jgi:asparagine synthase (glutamine-hydrolysing)
MCGIIGYMDLRDERPADERLLLRMADRVIHRGPDSSGYLIDGSVAIGFRRLSIIDIEGGHQPLYNEDGSVAIVCNGEIYNYRELKAPLIERGHKFRTLSDIEVLVHLYEEEGIDFLDKINGQFAFALYDKTERKLILARDHFGINPLYYTVAGGSLVFASEIKAILEHPLVERNVDLTGLDQILSFPGLVTPRTMFKGIESLRSGHYLTVKTGNLEIREYWDLEYPEDGELDYDKPEECYVNGLKELLAQSVSYRLQADVPVGFYLSGGLDSSLVAATMKRVSHDTGQRSFSISFTEKEISETKYQRMMASAVGSHHTEVSFDWPEIAARLFAMVYHCECPVKESFNTCALALSEAVKDAGIKVVLTGQGADELFAGYIGYRFDQSGVRRSKKYDLETILEDELRERLWGDKDIFYEADQYPIRETKSALYSSAVNELFSDFDCLKFALVNKARLKNRHFIHQRSYLDVKLRLSDHLLSEHGDRMAMANSIEVRHPFLDVNVVEFAKQIPPDLKLKNFTEKYVLKRVADGMVPTKIIEREKFGFRAPGSSYLLKRNIDWINDLLSPSHIARQGYFNTDVIESLRKRYMKEDFTLNPHLEGDLLMIVITFGIFLSIFNMPNLK